MDGLGLSWLRDQKLRDSPKIKTYVAIPIAYERHCRGGQDLTIADGGCPDSSVIGLERPGKLEKSDSTEERYTSPAGPAVRTWGHRQ